MADMLGSPFGDKLSDYNSVEFSDVANLWLEVSMGLSPSFCGNRRTEAVDGKFRPIGLL